MMNELRWILLGIGIVIIAIIYFLGTRKTRHDIRSRVEHYPSLDKNSLSEVKLDPGKDKLMDISGALTALNTFLKQIRETTDPHEAQLHKESSKPEADNKPGGIAGPGTAETAEYKEKTIIVIYITAKPPSVFKGDELLNILESSNMQFGAMDIFHHYGPDKNYSSRALFNLANIHEPGTFDIENMDTFTTDGLAMFMRLPAEIGGDIAMEIMLDTAQNISYLLDGELRGADRKLLTIDNINKLRETAGQY
jgi:cell division protein ZipA